jgi:type I restriction enzyme S subunit
MIDTKNAYKRLLSMTEQLVKSRFVEMFGDLESNPMGWEVRKLRELGRVGSSHRVFTTEFIDVGVPFYRGTEVAALSKGEYLETKHYISETHYESLKDASGVPDIGDLLLPSICANGEVWRVDNDSPFYFKDGRVLWFHLEADSVDSKYLRFALSDTLIRDYWKIASGTTFAEMKIVTLKEIGLLMPPLALQTRFAAFAEAADKSKFVAWEVIQIVNKTAKMITDLLSNHSKQKRKESDDVQ